MNQPLQCQTEASRFAQRREGAVQRAAYIRENGHRVALVHLVNGERGKALTVVMRTFHQQARALGLHLHQTESGRTW